MEEAMMKRRKRRAVQSTLTASHPEAVESR